MISPRMIVTFGSTKITINSERALGKLHDEVWKRINNLIVKHNPCKIKENSCYCYENNLHPSPFCCGHCKYLTEMGCTTQSLTCK